MITQILKRKQKDNKQKKSLDESKRYFDEGLKYINLREYDKVIECYTKCIKLLKKYPPHIEQLASSYNNRGLAYYNKGNYDIAIKDYNEAIRLDPNIKNTHCNRGLVYYNKGNYDKAIKDFNEAIRLNSQDHIAYQNRGLAYSEKGDNEKAILDFNISKSCDDKLETFNKIFDSTMKDQKYITKMQDREMLPHFGNESWTREIIFNKNFVNSYINIDQEVFAEDVSIEEVLSKIENFETQDISQLNEDQIGQFIVDILQVNSQYYFSRKTNNIPSGSSFYRVRKLNDKIFEDRTTIDSKKVRALLSNEKEFWACPKHLITEYGRLNKPNESVLYTTIGDIITPLYETNITKDDIFLLIKYKSRHTITVGTITEYESVDTSNQFEKIMKLYSEFIIKQFRKKENKNKDYILTNTVKNLFFNTMNVLAYPSIKNNFQFNVAFSGETAQTYLGLDTVLLCSNIILDSPKFGLTGLTIRGSIEFLKNTGIVLYGRPNYEEFNRLMSEFLSQ